MSYSEKIDHARQRIIFVPVSLFKASYPNIRNTRKSGSVIQRGFRCYPRRAVKGHGFGLSKLQPQMNKMLSISLKGETPSLQRNLVLLESISLKGEKSSLFETQFLLSQLDLLPRKNKFALPHQNSSVSKVFEMVNKSSLLLLLI